MPRDLEHKQQAALFDWARFSFKRYPELKYLFAVPNGGHRHAAVAGKLKREGVKPGVPDVYLDVARGGYHGLRIEMKVGKNKPSEKQAAWIANLQKEEYFAFVCYSWTEARDVIIDYLGGHVVSGRDSAA